MDAGPELGTHTSCAELVGEGEAEVQAIWLLWPGDRGRREGDTLQEQPKPQGALTSDFPRDCCTSFRNSSWCSASSRWPSKIWPQMIPGKGTEH